MQSTPSPLSRRRFLAGAGVSLALPALDALARGREETPPRRILAICNNLGVLPDKFFPSEPGRGYALSPYLEVLKDHREDFTVFSGVWHPDVDGGHPADNCFLTCAPHPSNGGFRNTISLDQFAARYIGHETRFPSMTLGVNVKAGRRSLSWTSNGVLIPCEERPSEVFKRMFLSGNADEIEAQIRRLELGRSIMDSVKDQARSLKKNLAGRDRDRLEQYFTGVRDLEARLEKAKAWERVPKPEPRGTMPEDPATPALYLRKIELMYDMARLAIETDSTRLIALLLDGVNTPAMELPGCDIRNGYHWLSHHGRRKEKREKVEAIDRAHLKLLDGLLAGLKGAKEGGETLLDRTMVLYGSNLGNANTHVTTNLPILFAGGGFRHGQHLAFNRERNYPLPNLFVSMLQRLGLEVDRFATSTGTMRGLEPV